jgi:plastocyanin
MREHLGRAHLWLLILLLLPFVLAGKCIDYNPILTGEVGPDGLGGSPTPGSTTAQSGGSDTYEFMPAVSCKEPGLARFEVANYQFKILCGCLEEKGKVCTVPVDTTITWMFTDTDEHNVKAKNNSFMGSGDVLVGNHSQDFPHPGSFEYKCSVHPEDMFGYFIEVIDPADPPEGLR